MYNVKDSSRVLNVVRAVANQIENNLEDDINTGIVQGFEGV